MQSYKLIMLLKSDIKREAKEKLFDDVKKWIGEIKRERFESLGEKKLAYPIKQARKGEYVTLDFESERVTDDLNRRLLIREEILRHLLVRY